jgi:hypothetical protein
MLGLQATGAITETSPLRVTCCAGPAGLFQMAAPVCPNTPSGIPAGDEPLP